MESTSSHVDTLIIGAGQAGLAMSYCLSQQGRPHLILEQAARVANAWRHGRWDSFAMNTPNWSVRLPGAEYQGDDPDGFMERDEIVTYFERYAEKLEVPIRCGVRVTSVERTGNGYRIETDHGRYSATNVVIATGRFQRPGIPSFSANLPPKNMQCHSSQYRSPAALPSGAVLVVGSADSGCQIAEELSQSGRLVYLSTGVAPRFPRRYRGRDAMWWAAKLFGPQTVDQLPSPKAKFAPNPTVSGKDGGHTLNLHQFARDGIVLLGNSRGACDGTIALAPDLIENLAAADKAETEFVTAVDAYIVQNGLDAPEERLSELRDGYASKQILELDLESTGITCVVWATGYTFDFSLVKLPVFDEDGYPVQRRGVTDYPGLYFVGLRWLHTFASGLIAGVGEDAAHIARHIQDDGQP